MRLLLSQAPFFLIFLIAGLVLPIVGCDSPKSAPEPVDMCGPASIQYPNTTPGSGARVIKGVAQYQRYYPKQVGGGMDYGLRKTLPIRRALIQIVSGDQILACGLSDDGGNYQIILPNVQVSGFTVRALARSSVIRYQPDTVFIAGQDGKCNQASWDIRVVNNATRNTNSQTNILLRPQYTLDSSLQSGFSGAETRTVNLMAEMAMGGASYTKRAGAPFAILDTLLLGIETGCQGKADRVFPTLYANWSPDNSVAAGGRFNGDIGTSFFTTEGTSEIGNLYLLGKENSDTDELDNHIIAHEFGHYLENKIYRSDSIGGPHALLDSLDPRLAFGEGFGNAFSAIVHYNPISNTEDNKYIDTSGNQQGGSFTNDVSVAPTGDDRGPWSETAVQYFVWSLWRSAGASRSFSRIHDVLENVNKVTPGMTNLLTFASGYAQRFGKSTDGLEALWTGAIASPIDALCTGTCGSSSYSYWDPNNQLGIAYESTRKYPQGSGGPNKSREFWRLYRTLSPGATLANQHDVIDKGAYLSPGFQNKFGVRRLYRVVASGTQMTVNVTQIYQMSDTCSNGDRLDMAAYDHGKMIAVDEKDTGPTANCPSVTFQTKPGSEYIIEIAGYDTVTGYDLKVQ